jgi:predicted glutamine amidotransferase
VEKPGRKDGWGINFLRRRVFKDPQPSFNSPIAKLVQDYPIKSHGHRPYSPGEPR